MYRIEENQDFLLPCNKKVAEKKGMLIALEGIDYSGKTTAAHKLVDELNKQGVDAVYLREPTNESPASMLIKHLSNGTDPHITNVTLTSLFILDRLYDIVYNIRPLLSQGKTIVMDRYFLSNAVYQGLYSEDWHELLTYNRLFAPEPDITFVLIVSHEELTRRMIERAKVGQETDLTTEDQLAHLLVLQQIYKTIAFDEDHKDTIGNYICIHADMSPFEVVDEMYYYILM